MQICYDISISEILYHYHNVENYMTIINISIIFHITNNNITAVSCTQLHSLAKKPSSTQKALKMLKWKKLNPVIELMS